MTNADTENRARRIIERLKMFNRKERDHLMKFALCEKPEEPRISNALWKKISNGGTRPNADKMFIGMDYHLNWLYAALALAKKSDEELEKRFDNEWECKAPPKGHKNSRPIQDNQEDVDLLIAWFDQRWAVPLRLILVEAKLDSGWLSEQIDSKLNRISSIRNDAIDQSLKFIDWRFLLMAPKAPSNRCKKIKSILKDERYLWALDRDGKDPKFSHVAWKLPNGRASVNRVSRNWSRWKVSSRN